MVKKTSRLFSTSHSRSSLKVANIDLNYDFHIDSIFRLLISSLSYSRILRLDSKVLLTYYFIDGTQNFKIKYSSDQGNYRSRV